jgi:precorrin-6A/cobalt-precorrin-6A reductase
MKLLLLGGTADARQLAQALHGHGVEVIYSIAGLVRQPRLECRVISGGFSMRGGLQSFVMHEQVDAILDATHPYARRMSETALAVTRALEIPVWRYQRPPWKAQVGDDWRDFEDWAALPAMLQDRRSVFLTAGQLVPAFVDALPVHCPDGEQRQILRTATRPGMHLPDSMTWIEDIGPFDVDSERTLFERYQVDALVSKNSGGLATVAKLTVARERGVPVFLLRRPLLPAADIEFSTPDKCLDHIVGRARATA